MKGVVEGMVGDWKEISQDLVSHVKVFIIYVKINGKKPTAKNMT